LLSHINIHEICADRCSIWFPLNISYRNFKISPRSRCEDGITIWWLIGDFALVSQLFMILSSHHAGWTQGENSVFRLKKLAISELKLWRFPRDHTHLFLVFYNSCALPLVLKRGLQWLSCPHDKSISRWLYISLGPEEWTGHTHCSQQDPRFYSFVVLILSTCDDLSIVESGQTKIPTLNHNPVFSF